MNFIRKYELVLALLLVFCTTVPAQTFTPLPIADSIVVKNLNVKNTEIRDLLQGMAVQYGLNLFLAPDVRGPITINFNNQPLKDANRFCQSLSQLRLKSQSPRNSLRPKSIRQSRSMPFCRGIILSQSSNSMANLQS